MWLKDGVLWITVFAHVTVDLECQISNQIFDTNKRLLTKIGGFALLSEMLFT